MRTVLAVVLSLSSVALAADAAVGEAVYQERCARCHTSDRNAEEVKGKAPDLIKRMKQRSGEELNRWVLSPAERKRESACDTRALVAEPELASAVWAYLQGRLDAAPAPVQQRRRDELDRRAWRKRDDALNSDLKKVQR